MFRTAHIHVAVSQNGRRIFTTQMLVNGHPANARDNLSRRLDAAALKTILVDFAPLPGSKLGELSANFEIVLGSPSTNSSLGHRAAPRRGRDAVDHSIFSRAPLGDLPTFGEMTSHLIVIVKKFFRAHAESHLTRA